VKPVKARQDKCHDGYSGLGGSLLTKAVLPFSEGRKRRNRVGVGKATPFNQRSNDGRLAITQKRVGCLFDSNPGWNGGLAFVASCLLKLKPLGDCRIGWLRSTGKALVRDRVFVRAINLGGIRQRGEFVKRHRHLRRRAFKESAAATGK
jgi:hypothetical protein